MDACALYILSGNDRFDLPNVHGSLVGHSRRATAREQSNPFARLKDLTRSSLGDGAHIAIIQAHSDLESVSCRDAVLDRVACNRARDAAHDTRQD